MAVLASKAWMPRKSSFSALGGVVQVCQVVPSSVVRRTVPAVPLAHAIPLPRAWMPRRLAVVWDCWMVHWAGAVVVRARRIRVRRMKESISQGYLSARQQQRRYRLKGVSGFGDARNIGVLRLRCLQRAQAASLRMTSLAGGLGENRQQHRQGRLSLRFYIPTLRDEACEGWGTRAVGVG